MQHANKHSCSIHLKSHMKHWSIFATSIWNTYSIPLKHLQHLKQTLATCTFKRNIYLLLTKWRLSGVWSSPQVAYRRHHRPDRLYPRGRWGPLCGRQYPWLHAGSSPCSRRRSPHHHRISRRTIDLVEGAVRRSEVEAQAVLHDAGEQHERVGLSGPTDTRV
jgi:hypothetical protein